MAGQIKPGKGSPNTWYIRVELARGIDCKRRQRQETFKGTKREAERKLRDLLREAERGELTDERMTVADLLDRWLASREAQGRAHNTLAAYRVHIDYWIKPALGSLKVAQLRPVHVEQALSEWRTAPRRGKRTSKARPPLSARSVRHVFDTLRAAMRWAVDMGIILVSPVRHGMAPAFDAPEIVTLDREGIPKLLGEARKAPHPLVAPIIVAIGSGLRRGELLGLRWSDIDFKNQIVSVRRAVYIVDGKRHEKAPKTKRSARANVVPAFVLEALRQDSIEQKARRLAHGLGKDDDAFVFDDLAGQSWHPESFSWWVNTLCDRAGLPAVTLHALRRSYGTLLLEAGVGIATVSKSMGHSNTTITERAYIGVTPTLDRDAANRLDVHVGRAFEETA